MSVGYNEEKGLVKLKGEPYKISMKKNDSAKIKFQFYKYLNEPDYEINLKEEKEGNLLIEYDPKQGTWISEKWVEFKEPKFPLSKQK